MTLKKLLFSTSNDTGLTLARVMLGLVMFPHGAQKVLGWFGGYGWSGTMGFFTQQMGIPAIFAVLAILAEFLGAFGLITGLFGRIAAFGILTNMVVAVAMVHAKVGFFMNWGGTQQGEGYEYALLAGTLALLIVWKGSGAYSADRLIAAKA